MLKLACVLTVLLVHTAVTLTSVNAEEGGTGEVTVVSGLGSGGLSGDSDSTDGAIGGTVDTSVRQPGMSGSRADGSSTGSGRSVGTAGAGVVEGGNGSDASLGDRSFDGSPCEGLTNLTPLGVDVCFPPPVDVAAAGAPAAAPVVTPEQLAVEAFRQLALPRPTASFSPKVEPGRFQLVNLPMWWWVTNFAPLSQRVQAGAVWAVTTATPVRSVLDGGEGEQPAMCGGPGQAWRPGLPPDYRPACTYTYARSHEDVTATVTVFWQVSWVGSGGTSGQLAELGISTAVPLKVYERQAVNVPVGSRS